MICQEETEPDRWVRERGQEEEWADVSAHQSMDNILSMEADASVALDAGAWPATGGDQAACNAAISGSMEMPAAFSAFAAASCKIISRSWAAR